jgi:hypothetical protein
MSLRKTYYYTCINDSIFFNDTLSFKVRDKKNKSCIIPERFDYYRLK